MTAILKIKVEDLTPQFLERVKRDYPNQELEIRIGEPAHPDLLEETQFWEIISMLDWSKEENDEIIAPAIKYLAERPVHFIYLFQDILAQKLFQLDQKKYALHIGEAAWKEGKYFSVDNFLYARCCVVANGKKLFEEVLANPAEMPQDITFEAVLWIAKKAYQQKTDKKFEYFPTPSYETYSNQAGWQTEN
ncbi:MAG: DUF4240 domain-containing protein [Saprospiraceae bacterium]